MIDMQGKYKSFDPEMYKEHNDRAIYRVLEYVADSGVHATVNPDQYGPDIVIYKGFRPASYIEVEVVRKWKSSPFPWSHIHILERKLKYLNLGRPIEFYRLNVTLQRAVIVPDFEVTKVQLQEVRNQQIESGELMCRIPLENCIEIDFEEINDADSISNEKQV